jgi:hypothetical protein
MSSKEIKELRTAGRLDEAYAMAKSELETNPQNIWSQRSLSWVLYSQLDAAAANISDFITKIDEVKLLSLPATEIMFFENISIVIAKAARAITHDKDFNQENIHQLFDSIKDLPLQKSTKWYSVIFEALHKGMKESPRYLEFADWWDLSNLKPQDFEKEKLPNGKEKMAIAEQAYIAYAKHILPIKTPMGEIIFDKAKALKLQPTLADLAEKYPQQIYFSYFNVKLLLALNEKENILNSILPFAKKKPNDFWVWQLFAEAFESDPDKVFACYCRALSCKSPEEMLVSLRQKMAQILITKNLFNEAKTEIEKLVEARTSHGFKIPGQIINWQSQEWYKNAIAKKSNTDFYLQYISLAESLLYSDIPEENVIVEFVNKDKSILNFIASETKHGFFKYDKFLNNIKVGEILKVRFKSGAVGGIYQIYSASSSNDETFKSQFLKEVEGEIRIQEGKSFGFLGDAYIHPALIAQLKLTNGMKFIGNCIKTYNQDKKQWGWKLIKSS